MGDKLGWGGVEWFHPVQSREQWRTPVNTVMNLPVLLKARNFRNGWVTIAFSRNLLHGV